MQRSTNRTKVTVQAGAYVVPVQPVDVLAPPQHQLLLEGLRDGALPAATETGHPQGGTLLPHGRVSLGAGQVAHLVIFGWVFPGNEISRKGMGEDKFSFKEKHDLGEKTYT